MDGVKI